MPGPRSSKLKLRSSSPKDLEPAGRGVASAAELERWIAKNVRGPLAQLAEWLTSCDWTSAPGTTVSLEPDRIVFSCGEPFAFLTPAKPRAFVLTLPRGAELVGGGSGYWKQLEGRGMAERRITFDAHSMVADNSLAEVLEQASRLAGTRSGGR